MATLQANSQDTYRLSSRPRGDSIGTIPIVPSRSHNPAREESLALVRSMESTPSPNDLRLNEILGSDGNKPRVPRHPVPSLDQVFPN